MSGCGFQAYIAISEKCGGAKKAIAYYKKVFGATVKMAVASGDRPDKIMHGELKFGDTTLMISDAFPGFSKTPEDLGGTPVTFFLSIPKGSKAAYDAAIAEGAKVMEGREYKDQPWGWTAGTIVDPFGYAWTVGEDTKGWSDKEIAENMGVKDVTAEV